MLTRMIIIFSKTFCLQWNNKPWENSEKPEFSLRGTKQMEQESLGGLLHASAKSANPWGTGGKLDDPSPWSYTKTTKYKPQKHYSISILLHWRSLLQQKKKSSLLFFSSVVAIYENEDTFRGVRYVVRDVDTWYGCWSENKQLFVVT